MDIRLKQLSYSSVLTLHSCPRKYELYKLKATEDREKVDPNSLSGITFAYGHTVGLGLQLVLEGKSTAEIYLALFLHWEPDYLAEDTRNKKNFHSALVAVEKFKSLYDAGFLQDYELVYHEGIAAVELGFCIHCPDDFVYRGFVDAVLKHRTSGKILVLECKTTGAKSVNPATYKNSAQAIGYSIVLDYLFAEASHYEVLYMVYRSSAMEWDSFRFEKSYLMRAQWIQELFLDIKTIQMYNQVGVFPMHGESCFDFYRECPEFGTCTLSTEYQIEKLTPELEAKIAAENLKYQVHVQLEDLIHTQLAKE